MNSITLDKIDLACENPGKSSKFYESVFDIAFQELPINNSNHFLGDFGAFKLFLCPKEIANVKDSKNGVHQIHLSLNMVKEKFISNLDELGINFQNVNFEPNKDQICIRDLDGNPWIISFETQKYQFNPNIAVEIENIEKAEKFYTEIFGFSILKRAENGEITISDNKNLSILFSEGNVGETWFAIDTDNLEEAIKKLKSKGCEIIKIENSPNGVLVKDPFGFKFYLSKFE